MSDSNDVRVETEQIVAKHILKAALDGCSCEPCLSVQALLQSATERLPCGHWKGDFIEQKRETLQPAGGVALEGIKVTGYCRTCKEILERTAAAMVAQRDADAKLCDTWAENVKDNFLDQAMAVWQRATDIRNAPLASAESQKWLEDYVATRCAGVIAAIGREIDAAIKRNEVDEESNGILGYILLHVSEEDASNALAHQLAVARADAYRQCSIEMCPNCRKEIPAKKNSHGFWYHDSEPCKAGELLDLVAEAEAQAREVEADPEKLSEKP